MVEDFTSEEQANKVNVDNVEDLLPEQTHHMGAGTLYLSYMTSRWIMKQLKRNPHKNIRGVKRIKMKIFEFKVIEDNKETYVQIEATSMYNALDVIIQEENISHIYSIKDINGYERWDFYR